MSELEIDTEGVGGGEMKHIRNRRNFHEILRKLEINLEFEVCNIFATLSAQWLYCNQTIPILNPTYPGFQGGRGCSTGCQDEPT